MKPRSYLSRLLLGGATLLLGAFPASAHIGYTNRDFGTVVPDAAPVTISNQTVTSNFGWADGTDEDFGDSHKLRAYRFSLAAPAYVTITFSGSTNGGTRDGSIKPAFSVYQGLAHLPPISNAPGGSADHDGSAISLAYLATLGGVAKEGVFRSLADWRVGGDNQTGPAFDFEAADGLSTFVFKGYVVDGDATLFGSAPGIVGDGNADGTVTKSLYLPAGNYSVFVGGANYAGQSPTPDATVYGLTGTISASVFTYVAGDPAEGGVGYQHQVTLGGKSAGGFSSHVGAWSWEDNSLFGNEGQGTEPVGWTHTSNWVALRLEQPAAITVTMARDAAVPWPSAQDPGRLADTTSMFPSMTLYRNWDNDGDDFHTYNNRGNVDWAEDLQYLAHVDNSTATSITRTWFLPAGDYSLALGSNAPANNTNRQGYSINFSTAPVGRADPVITPGGIGYTYTVLAGAGESGNFSSHVGAWSWEDNALFGGAGQGTQPVGWTHTSNWVALKLKEEVFFSLTVERDAAVPWPSAQDPNRLADTSSMFPSLTLYRGWDNDGTDSHTYNNRGHVTWAEDIRYMDHVDNSTSESITRVWRLPAGEYSIALGSNAPANNTNRQGYKATFTTRSVGAPIVGDPAAGGVEYAHVISVARGESGILSNHVGAWSWEDDSLFNASEGEQPVGWTHTSRWVAVHVKDSMTLNITMSRNANVPWASAPVELNGKADTAAMFPSFTLWRGWDNDVTPPSFRSRADIVASWEPYGGVPPDLGDHHTYNNRGNVDWAEDLTYVDHCDNSTAETITRSYTLEPGYYTFALGSNAPANNTNRQGFSFAWTTGAPALVGPVITQHPKGAEVLAGKKASFSVKAAGPNLSYQWFFEGQPVPGATNTTLNLDNVGPANAGNYTCQARNAAGWATSQAAALGVVSRPVVDAFDIPDLIVGQWVQIQLTATGNPASFTAKGLPKGLALNAKTGVISGRPSEIKTLVTVEVTATNRAGVSARVTDTFAVNTLPLGVGGSFTGPLGRSLGLNSLLGGYVKVEISSLGALSGSITLGGAAPLRFTAGVNTAAASPTASFQVARKGQSPLLVTLAVEAATRTLRGQVEDGNTVLPFVARQPLNPLGSYPGNYTMALPLDPLDVGTESIPQGHSVGAFRVAANGAASGVLLLADNTRVTFGGPLEQEGCITIFSPLYKGEGSVLGLLCISSTDQTLAFSEVTWFKGAVAKDLVYGEGFGPLPLQVVGGKYTIPAAGQLPLNATAGAGNAKLSFEHGGAPDPATRLDTAALQIDATKVTVGTPNPGKVKLTVDAGKPTGVFTPGIHASFKGSFELSDTDTTVTPNKTLVRKADFQGMLVNDGTEVKGFGFFLLPKMPTATPKTTLATSPRLSGTVLLETVTTQP